MISRVCMIAAMAVVGAGCDGQSDAPSSPPPAPSSASPASAAGSALGRVIGHAVRTDVDGDGRVDRAVLHVGANRHRGLRDVLVVSLGRGGQLRLPLIDAGSSRFPANRLLGHADINGDDASELVVFLSGNTQFSAAIVTVVKHQLTRAQSPELVPVFAAHGTGCGACTQDATCQPVDGQPRLVETFSTYLSKRGRDLTGVEQAKTHDTSPLASHRRRWEATIYDLRGPTLVRTGEDGGVVPPGGSLPTQYRFDGALNCGTAHWDIGSP